ncbi:hypothetical protein HZ326_5080 [Fusarium oxysporum f. sp. albedinis]|nr:hypothetical protein HZ326_5080 [Fusarium oxysporum f. sp. albedinis]
MSAEQGPGMDVLSFTEHLLGQPQNPSYHIFLAAVLPRLALHIVIFFLKRYVHTIQLVNDFSSSYLHGYARARGWDFLNGSRLRKKVTFMINWRCCTLYLG